MDFIIFMLLILPAFWLVSRLLSKWLGKDKRTIADTEGKLLDRWGRGVILLIALILLTIIKDMPDSRAAMQWYWLFFMTTVFGFQSFLQWRYLKGSKEYLKTLLFLLFFIVVWSIMSVVWYPEVF